MGVYLKIVVKRAFRVVSGICETDMIPLSYDRRKNVGVVFFALRNIGADRTQLLFDQSSSIRLLAVLSTGSTFCTRVCTRISCTWPVRTGMAIQYQYGILYSCGTCINTYVLSTYEYSTYILYEYIDY